VVLAPSIIRAIALCNYPEDSHFDNRRQLLNFVSAHEEIHL
jgi:hypothetical protein